MEWQRKRPDQRKKLIKQFDEADLVCEQVVVHASQALSSVKQCVRVSEQPPTSSGQIGTSCPPRQVSISFSESGITSLHTSVLEPMWKKANNLLSAERGIQHAASSDPTAWSVQSFSSAVPHFVTSKENGQFLCDAQCLQWVSTKICSHTVAAAERSGHLSKFLKWYVATTSVQTSPLPEC